MDRYPISEMFGPTIQGEGPVVGRRTVFVRFAGCDYRCVWCDSKQTWQAPIVKEMMSQEQIWGWLYRKYQQTGVRTITVSGGNPGLYDLTELLEPLVEGLGDNKPWDVSVETQGSFVQEWFHLARWLVISPKPPSSGMKTDWMTLEKCLLAGRRPNTFLKVVIFSEEDYQYARDVNRRFADYPLYLSVGTYAPEREHEGESVKPVGIDRKPERDTASAILDRAVDLAERVTQDRGWVSDPYVLPQVHVLYWGHKRGV